MLEWENVTFSVKSKKILQNVSGCVESGEMLASTSSVLRVRSIF